MLKRVVDLVLTLLAMPLVVPLVVIVAVAVWWKLGRPVLFRQIRPGYLGRPFTLYKFRTMLDGDGPDEERLTALGRWLRRTSLDELPELWNVLRGDMSLVGPRPLLMQYLKEYSPEQARRHEVRPGITGLAQINGRNDIDWAEKLALDVRYVDGRSVWLDFKILLATPFAVLGQRGVNKAGHATTDVFTRPKS